jgi:hypothetical protein
MTGDSVKRCIVLASLVWWGLLLVCAGCEKETDTKAEKVEFEIDKVYERGPLTVPLGLSIGTI